MRDDRAATRTLYAVFLLLFISPVAPAADKSGQRQQLPGKPPLVAILTPEAVVAEDVAAQDAGNWDAYLRLRTELPGAPEDVAGYRTLWESGGRGIRANVLSARLVSLTAIPFDVAQQVIGSSPYMERLADPQAFYAIVDYDVRADDQYVCDGANARLYILDRGAGGWKIAQVSEPPLRALQIRGFATGTAAEQDLVERQEIRTRTGRFMNARGDVVFSVSPDVAGDHQIPSSITVAHSTVYPDCQYQSMIGCVDFNTYVKNVLPNEWITTWPSESLKAGAIAAKMYGWYRVYYPKYPNKGYDVLDQDCDQVYRANSAVTSTNNAVNAVAGVGFDRADGVLVQPQYSAGSYGNAGYHGGRIYQNGTHWLADNGYSYLDAYKDMVRYYYDSSSLTSGQAIHFFTYSEGSGGCPSPLTVTVTSPVGGENWQTGTSHGITWTVSGATSDINYWKVALSTDGGATWPTTVEDPRQLSGGIFNPGARSWTWTIESSWNTSQARIRVRALDVGGNILKDGISPANFTISSAETVSTPSTPTGPATGSAGSSYSYSVGGSTSSLGHSIQYQIDWGDGQSTGWLASGTTSASHAWTSAGTYNVKAQARCATHTSVVSSYSASKSVTISATETVSTPSTPTGPSSGSVGSSYTYATGGSSSSLGHSIQYHFDWGDGQASGWLSSGTTSASHSWSSPGTYSVVTQARCVTHTSVVSGSSNSASVTISSVQGETVSTPNTPSGTSTGVTGTNYSYSTGGSTSSLGHALQYQFEWGDGQLSGWLPTGTTGASHVWSSAAAYAVRAQARCATHTNVTSGSSGGLSVTISTPGGGSTELIVDGGFEDATATGNVAPGWAVYPSPGSNHSLIIRNGPVPHGGTNYAFLGSTDSTEYDWLLQTVAIPSDATAANLTLSASISTEEAPGDAYDFLWVAIYDTAGNPMASPVELSNEDAASSNNTLGSYFQVGPVDLLAYKGMSVQVAFIAYTDFSLPTTFLVDDVSLRISTGSDSAPSTSITTPANGATVSGTVNVSATASDDNAVTSLQVLIDGVVRASNANSTSLSYAWNTADVANGQHSIVSKAGDAAGHITTSSTVTVTVANVTLTAPTNLNAVATSASAVSLTWNDVTGAAQYQILRSSNNSAYSLVGTAPGNAFTNTGLSSNTTYVYRVKAVDSSGNIGPAGNADLATTIVFSNDPLVVRATPIRAAHITELRTAVNAVRAAAGLSQAAFDSSVVAGAPISRLHITELRANLDAARTVLGVPALSYTDASLAAGGTPVKAAHIMELRNGVK